MGDALTLVLRSDRAVVRVDLARGGRLTGLELDGVELLTSAAHLGPGPRSWFDGSFPMAPYAGSLRDGRFTFRGVGYQMPRNNGPHSAHGLVDDVPWEVVEHAGSTVTLRTDLPEPWPFGGRVQQSVVLGETFVETRLLVTNAERVMPAALGFHPWFRRDLGHGPVEIEVDPALRYQPFAPGIPGELGPDLGERPWDDVFTGLASAPRLRWPGGPHLTVESDAPVWMIYERQVEGVCVEPLTAPPNSLGTDRGHVVGPGADLGLRMRLVWA